MSDKKLEIEVNRLVLHSGFKKSEDMLSPILKIIKMRHKEVGRTQALRVAKDILK